MSLFLKVIYRRCKLPKLQGQRRFLQTVPLQKQKTYRYNEIVPVFRKAAVFTDKVALRDSIGSYTYTNLFLEAKELSKEITTLTHGKTGERILFLCPNDANYVVTQWAIWMAGQIAVPLSNLHPQNMLLYYCNDCSARLLMTTPEYTDLMHRVAKNTNTPLHVIKDKLRQDCGQRIAERASDLEFGLPCDFYSGADAMILYTSGTTGNPKGVVISHKNLTSQVNVLLDAWKWSESDVILHTLPLNHVHGIVNALLCPFYAGAKCNMLPKFDANSVWSHLLGVNAAPTDRKMTVFMAVPTIYSKLIDEYERIFGSDPKMAEYIHNTLKNKIRLMVSGSAPLPAPVYEKWLEISGHKLLERYGMTETGMCLSQLYNSDREPGHVGVPLPGVTVRVCVKSEEGDKIKSTLALEASNNNGTVQVKKLDNSCPDDVVTGELQVKGDSVFKAYFNRPEATQREFTSDGFFKTGDVCQYSFKRRTFKMLGRTSVDIIKTGGFKVSALEIETHLLAHPDVKDCSIIGLKDETWGEKVAAVVVLKSQKELALETLKAWAKEKMPEYAAPQVLKIVDSIPKNAMGKINKKELTKLLFEPEENLAVKRAD